MSHQKRLLGKLGGAESRQIRSRLTVTSSPVQPSRWPHYGKNTESVGELWLGLLRFYTEDFDFREHVVCIRQHACLTTFNKQWTSKYIVIEGKRHRSHCRGSSLKWNGAWLVWWGCVLSSLISDPFDLNHNLGAGLSRKSKIVCFFLHLFSFTRLPVAFWSYFSPWQWPTLSWRPLSTAEQCLALHGRPFRPSIRPRWSVSSI